MNQGTICAKVYPEGIQPVKGNNCGLIPIRPSFWHLNSKLCHLIYFYTFLEVILLVLGQLLTL